MPEGDTVHRLARTLGAGLLGRRLEGLWLRDRGWVDGLRGHRVAEVSALGKNLLFAFEPHRADPAARFVLRVHLGMHGRWRRRAAGAPASRSRPSTSAVLQTDGWMHVCERAAAAELVRRTELSALPALRRLGPDLLAPAFDPGAWVARARRVEPRTACDLLLDQRVVCGIGNVIAVEALFLEGVHPRRPVAGLADPTLAALFGCARRLLAAQVRDDSGRHRRTTVRVRGRPGRPAPDDPRLWVYDRAGEPCLRCGTRIEAARLGDAARPTWWCPRCQPEPAGQR